MTCSAVAAGRSPLIRGKQHSPLGRFDPHGHLSIKTSLKQSSELYHIKRSKPLQSYLCIRATSERLQRRVLPGTCAPVPSEVRRLDGLRMSDDVALMQIFWIADMWSQKLFKTCIFRGEYPVFNLFPVVPDRLERRLLQVRITLHELRDEPFEHADDIMKHQHLAVAKRSRPYAYGRD